MALPPGYLGLVAAADALGIELDKEQAVAIERYLNAHGREIVATWQVDESKRHGGFFAPWNESAATSDRDVWLDTYVTRDGYLRRTPRDDHSE